MPERVLYRRLGNKLSGLAFCNVSLACREFPSVNNCSVAVSADTDKELLEVAVQHAVSVHQHQDTPELRTQLKQLFKVGTPPIEAPRKQAA